MGRKSSIERLPKPVRDTVAKLIRDNRLTLDEIVDKLRSEFGEAPSRSAVHRYKQTLDEALAKQREMDGIAEIWVREVKDQPQGKMGRMVLELLRTVAMQSALNAQSKDQIDPKELAHIARAFNLIESAGKREAENRAMLRDELRQELLAEQDEKLKAAVKATGLSAETADALRRQILGIGE
jgi:hypothetical protein